MDPLNYYHFNQRQPAGIPFRESNSHLFDWPNHEIGATGAKEVASNLSSRIWVPAGVCSSSGWLYS